jgi:hypothetical protein
MNSSEERQQPCVRAIEKWADKIHKNYGLSPRYEGEMHKAIVFKLPREEAESIAECHLVDALKEGIYIFASNNFLVIYPGTDKFEVVKWMATNGANYGITTAQIIHALRKIDNDYPFSLTGIGYDFVSGTFTSDIKNPMPLAKALYEICQDFIDQGSGTLEIASSELHKTKRLFLWWD